MQPGKRSWPASVLTLARECPAIQLSTMPEVALDPWWELASRFRQSRHYLRFLRPEYRGTPELLARARTRAPRPAVRLGEWIGKRDRARRLIVHLLSLLEQSTRSAAVYHQYLREHRPDIVSGLLRDLDEAGRTGHVDFGQAVADDVEADDEEPLGPQPWPQSGGDLAVTQG